jgi:YfiH family protein
VYTIENNSGEWNQSEGDALATRVENVALGVQVADCLPILMADPVGHAIAAVHSGWRGTLTRVLQQTILQMQESFGSLPSDLITVVGPGIRACCFEVGAEVVELFQKEYRDSRLAEPVADCREKYLLDLGKALEIQLDLAGVRHANRYDLSVCTRCHPGRFFSYRAEGPSAGRMMAVIGLKKTDN